MKTTTTMTMMVVIAMIKPTQQAPLGRDLRARFHTNYNCKTASLTQGFLPSFSSQLVPNHLGRLATPRQLYTPLAGKDSSNNDKDLLLKMKNMARNSLRDGAVRPIQASNALRKVQTEQPYVIYGAFGIISALLAASFIFHF
eukprot:jgi/Bigna1/61878/fgenesh1_kg.27_\